MLSPDVIELSDIPSPAPFFWEDLLVGTFSRWKNVPGYSSWGPKLVVNLSSCNTCFYECLFGLISYYSIFCGFFVDTMAHEEISYSKYSILMVDK